MGETKHIAITSDAKSSLTQNPNDGTGEMLDHQTEQTGSDKDAGAPSTVGVDAAGAMDRQLSLSQDVSKQGTGLVASRALELNGVASASDGGDDTASQGGSESDTSRTDAKSHTRTGSVKKPATFKPVSFAKFAVPKAPGVPTPPKAPEKGNHEILSVPDKRRPFSDLCPVPPASTTPLGTPQPSARPRLVAKTTAGMRDPFSKTSATGAKPGASGPDPNQVWNKNKRTCCHREA